MAPPCKSICVKLNLLFDSLDDPTSPLDDTLLFDVELVLAPLLLTLESGYAKVIEPAP